MLPTQAPSSPQGWPTSQPLMAGALALLSNLLWLPSALAALPGGVLASSCSKEDWR